MFQPGMSWMDVFSGWDFGHYVAIFTAQDVAYPLRLRRVEAKQIESRVRKTFDLLRLRGFGDFLIYRLSGPEGIEFLVQTDPRIEHPEDSDVIVKVRDGHFRIFS